MMSPYYTRQGGVCHGFSGHDFFDWRPNPGCEARGKQPKAPEASASGACFAYPISCRSFSMARFSRRDTWTWLTPRIRAHCCWVNPL